MCWRLWVVLAVSSLGPTHTASARSVGFGRPPMPLCAAPASRYKFERQSPRCFALAPRRALRLKLGCLAMSQNQEPIAEPPAAAATGGITQPNFTFVGTAADLRAYMQAQQLEQGEQAQEGKLEKKPPDGVSDNESVTVQDLLPPPAVAREGGVSLTLV